MTTKENILNELKSLTPVADRFTQHILYTVPSGYFEYFAEDMLRLIHAAEAGSVNEELEILSPFLKKLDKKTPFTVPEGYFNDFTATPSSQVIEAKVVQVSFGKKIFRYGAAAAVAGIIALASWFWINKPANQQAELAMATSQDVIDKVQEMTDSEMKAFLEGGTTLAYQNATSSTELKTEDVKLMLADVSDEELENYADQSYAVMQTLN